MSAVLKRKAPAPVEVEPIDAPADAQALYASELPKDILENFGKNGEMADDADKFDHEYQS